jgi:protein TonB
MSTLAMAMLLTGAGALVDDQGGKPPALPVPPIFYVPSPPMPPPPPPRIVPPQRARANLNSYFSVDDYPVAALVGLREGTASFRLTVGTEGRVTDCRVVQSSGTYQLDETTCRVLRARARYTPARGRDGTPREGTDSGRVTWRLPDGGRDRADMPLAYYPATQDDYGAGRVTARDYPPGAPPPLGAGTSEMRVAVGRQGQPIGCEIVTSSGSPALDAAACRLFSARARFHPARTREGLPACDIIWTGVDWTRAAANRRSAAPPGAAPPPAIPPRPLRQQLSATLCPGWPEAPPPAPAPGGPYLSHPRILLVSPPAPASPPPPLPPGFRPPVLTGADLQSYFHPDDFPAAALMAAQEGIVSVRLTVGPNGRVSDCAVTGSSGSAALDQATCRILRSRARYAPARDAAGAAISGTDRGRILWRLPQPGNDPAP